MFKDIKQEFLTLRKVCKETTENTYKTAVSKSLFT